jgi:DNA-binding transcriptional MerR regulator
MNIDFNAAFDAGMNSEDIKRMMEKQLKDAETAYVEKKAKEEEARQAKEKEAKTNAKNEKLKAEARAHAINAMIAYSEAFDLLDEDEGWDQEDIDKMEAVLIQIENMIPLYIKMAQMQEDIEKNFGFGLGFGDSH